MPNISFSSDIEYSSTYNHKHSKEARKILDLLQFAPNLERYKGVFDGKI